jgi:hypothetical protein
VFCAPAFYLKNHGGLDGFDLRISFEQLADFLDTGDRRAQYRATFLRNAADTKKINAWVRENDPDTNAFWDAAYALACKEFPILEMKQPGLTKDSVWIVFRPHDLPTMPKRVSIEVKGKSGHVDLTFANTTSYVSLAYDAKSGRSGTGALEVAACAAGSARQESAREGSACEEPVAATASVGTAPGADLHWSGVGKRPSPSTIAASIPANSRSIFASNSRWRMRATTGSRVRSESLISPLPTVSFSRSGTLFLNRKIPLSGCRLRDSNLMCTDRVYRRRSGKPFYFKRSAVLLLFFEGWRRGRDSNYPR